MHDVHHFNNTRKSENRRWIRWCHCSESPHRCTNHNQLLWVVEWSTFPSRAPVVEFHSASLKSAHCFYQLSVCVRHVQVGYPMKLHPGTASCTICRPINHTRLLQYEMLYIYLTRRTTNYSIDWKWWRDFFFFFFFFIEKCFFEATRNLNFSLRFFRKPRKICSSQICMNQWSMKTQTNGL